MAAWDGRIDDSDIAQVLAADYAVGRHFGGVAVPAYWEKIAQQAELGGDPASRWWTRQLAMNGDSGVAFQQVRGRSEEVTRRFVDPIIATTLVRGLPELPLATAVENCRSLKTVVGDETWQVYRAEVRHVAESVDASPDETRRMVAIGDANWRSRDAAGLTSWRRCPRPAHPSRRRTGCWSRPRRAGKGGTRSGSSLRDMRGELRPQGSSRPE